jgi:hypothetical protein
MSKSKDGKTSIELEIFLRENPDMIKYQLQLTEILSDMSGSGERLMFINNVMLHNLRDLQIELNGALNALNREVNRGIF